MSSNKSNVRCLTRTERKQLTAFDCEECARYYQSLGLSDEQIEAKMKFCSRHRNAIEAEKTTDDYWDLDFPSSPEIRRRNLTKNCVKKASESKQNEKKA